MSKRIISRIVIFALLTSMVLTACSKNSPAASGSSAAGDSSPSQETASAPAKKESVTLSVIINKDWYDDSIKWVMDEYQAKSGNKLDIQITPGGQAFNDALTTKAAVNELPDILFLYSSEASLKQMKADQLLVDLTNEPYIGKISKSIMDSGVWLKADGKVYEVPVGGFNTVGVIYNKQLFEQNGIQVPTTYEEFLAVCEKLKNASVTPIFEGLKDSWPPLLYNFIGFANEFTKKGAIQQMNDGTFDFTKSAEAQKLLTRQHELFEKGYMNKDAASATYDMEIAAFGQGKAAMVTQFDSFIPAVLQKFPDAANFIGMFRLPWDDDSVVPVDLARGIAIAKGKHEEAAKDFLTFLTSDEVLNGYYSKLKSLPPFNGVDAALDPGTAEMVQYVEAGNTVPFYSNLVTPGINIGFDLPGVILGIKSVDKALQEAQLQYIKSGKDNHIPGF